MKQFEIYIIIILLVVLIIPSFVSAYWWNPFSWHFWGDAWNNIFYSQTQQVKPTLCTQEAKICPDGSAVSRTGVNCEFAPCPGTKPDKKACNVCKDTDGGKNYYVRGAANPCSSNDKSAVCPSCGAWIDKCLNDKVLLEYSCDNLNGEQYNCPNGCNNGACRVQSNPKVCTSDSECPTGKKCFECHGPVLPSYVPVAHCYTQEEINALQAACAAM